MCTSTGYDDHERGHVTILLYKQYRFGGWLIVICNVIPDWLLLHRGKVRIVLSYRQPIFFRVSLHVFLIIYVLNCKSVKQPLVPSLVHQ